MNGGERGRSVWLGYSRKLSAANEEERGAREGGAEVWQWAWGQARAWKGSD
jgi:hypothetical protein